MQFSTSQLAWMQSLIDEHHVLAGDLTDQHSAWFLRNNDAPTRGDGNHVRRIRNGADIDIFFAAIEAHYAHLPFRSVRCDWFTPPPVEARLLAEDYQSQIEIVMGADGSLGGKPAAVEIRTVGCDSPDLARLVKLDSGEEWSGVWALIQRRADAFTWYVAYEDGQPAGHFSQRTRDGLGYLESLFVDPAYRLRGIATALTHYAAAAARAEGAKVVFLPAAADDTPKAMYRGMGFVPVYAFRNYWKTVTP